MNCNKVIKFCHKLAVYYRKDHLAKEKSKQYHSQLFKIELIDVLDPEHELVILTNKFN